MIGAQVVTYKTHTPGLTLDRKNIAEPGVFTPTTMYGSLQPMEVKETVTNIDYAIERYRFITPPTPVALAAKASDKIVDSAGLTYRVFGAKIKPRANGAPHHVEILLENPSGLNA